MCDADPPDDRHLPAPGDPPGAGRDDDPWADGGVAMRWRGEVYRLARGNWRGPDAGEVHFLTWVTDDLRRREGLPAADVEDDRALVRRAIERLGEDAEALGDD